MLSRSMSSTPQESAQRNQMSKRVVIAIAISVALLAAIAFIIYQSSGDSAATSRQHMLAAVPAAASTIVFADFAELRNSPFAAQLYSWAPQRQLDPDYAQFLRDTGFDYERDLDRIAIATIKHQQDTSLFAVADGRFDRKKLVVYASQFGTHEKIAGHETYSVPVNSAAPAATPAIANQKASPPSQPAPTPHKISFAFLSGNRVVVTTGPDPKALFPPIATGADAQDWRARFDRLAGSPIFAVIRQDAAPGATLASHAPGGLQSPQLSSLLDQLQWITIAGKPEGNILRVATEGECSADACSRQLADMINGILLLAQAGLNGPDVRRQLAPESREAYLELLKAAEVTRIDRGETKSVRLVLEVTPKFLAAARSSVPTQLSPAAPQK
jgi:hypothetical protein